MGVAAENRFKAKSLREFNEQTRAEADREVFRRVASRAGFTLQERKAPRPWGSGVIRQDSQGWLHIMNRRCGGWAEFSYWYPTWGALLSAWAIVVGAQGEDEHGPYWEFEPATEEGHA